MSLFVGAVLLVYCVLLNGPVNASYYARTASYRRDVILRCYHKDNRLVQTVINWPSVDVWHMDTSSVDIMMSRRTAHIVRRHLPQSCYVLVSNVESHVRKAEKKMLSPDQHLIAQRIKSGWDVIGQNIDDPNDSDWHTKYHNYESIITWYKNLAEKHSKLVKYTVIGQTAEKRDMIGVHITASTNPNRNKVYMQCLIHAREWISGAVCMYQAQKLVENYLEDSTGNNILNSMEFVIVPIVNPDGYAHTWGANRLWRKNRVENQGSNCRGVDLNRNFDIGWGKGESGTKNVCGNTYHGKEAGSELETQHVKNFFKSIGRIVASIDFHSYGQLVLRPYGWTHDAPQHEARLVTLGGEMASVMSQLYVSKKSIGLYKATGIASDWFYSDEVYKANKDIRPVSFTIELRDKGNSGFILPADQILPTAQEARRALLHLATSANHVPLTS